MHEAARVTADRSTAQARLPLVVIEHYMLADDRADYPMAFYVRLHLDRLPQREAFTRAVAEAIALHPLLSATVTPPAGRRRYWTWQQPTEPIILWPGDPPSDEPLDLARQCGLRINVEATEPGATLTLEFHHACCDGLGALNFTHDLFKAYQQRAAAVGSTSGVVASQGRQPNPAALQRLAKRGKFGIGPLRFLLRLPLETLGMLGVLEFLMHRPVPLCGSEGANPSPAISAGAEGRATHWPERFAHELTADETRALRAAAAACGATFNDLLVRDLFLTVGAWIDERKPSKRGAHIRLMVPVNLRTRHDGDLSAANVVAMINLDRRPRRWHNHRRLLRVLHWEMNIVKRARLGLTFIRALQITHYWLGKLKLLLAADKCQATCVLSNLGDPWRHLAGPDGRVVAGDVTVECIDMLPPIRPLTSLSIGAIGYAGRLNIAMQCDPRVLSHQESAELLALYVARLRQSAVAPADHCR